MVWVFMNDSTTRNIGLFDEPTAEGDPADRNSPRNAPLNDPEAFLAYVYWHILLDNMEVLFDVDVTVDHTQIPAATPVTDSTVPLYQPYDLDDAVIAHDVYTHDAGYEPIVLIAADSKALIPGYPVQVPSVPTGGWRYVAPFVTDTKVFLHEFRARSATLLPAQSITYRLLGVRRQRPAGGNDPPRDFHGDEATGLVTLGDGRWRNDRRYLQVAPGGSPIGLPFGRALSLEGGGIRIGLSDGTYVDPIPPDYIKQGLHVPGTTFGESDPLIYGAASYYTGDWQPGELIQVQAP